MCDDSVPTSGGCDRLIPTSGECIISQLKVLTN